MGICWAAGQKAQKELLNKNKTPWFLWTCMNMERSLTIKRRPPPLLPSLVEVTAGAHEAADHGGDDHHKEENGGGDAG